MSARRLGPDDIEQFWRLNQLAFGYRTESPAKDIGVVYGIDGRGGRLLAES